RVAHGPNVGNPDLHFRRYLGNPAAGARRGRRQGSDRRRPRAGRVRGPSGTYPRSDIDPARRTVRTHGRTRPPTSDRRSVPLGRTLGAGDIDAAAGRAPGGRESRGWHAALACRRSSRRWRSEVTRQRVAGSVILAGRIARSTPFHAMRFTANSVVPCTHAAPASYAIQYS